MKKLVEIRGQELMCRERAMLDSERKIFWLAQAEEWEQRALDEIAYHFRECNLDRAESQAARTEAHFPLEASDTGNRVLSSRTTARQLVCSLWMIGRQKSWRGGPQHSPWRHRAATASMRRSGRVMVCLTSAPQSEHS